jgi:predicted metalloprotease
MLGASLWTEPTGTGGLRAGRNADGPDMPHPLRHRLLPAVLVLWTVWLTGCATVVIGRPDARQSAPRTSGSSATVVGATGSAVDRLATDALADLEDYWSGVFPDVFGQEFVPLQGGYFSVDPGDVDPAQYPQGVGCGADPREVENNAFYCASPDAPNADSISYDRAFLGELGEGYGAFLPALVMAHEFGHAVQARVGTPATSIATETQADCLAGSWTRWVAEGEARRSQLREPELDDLLRGYFLLRDPVGTGTAEQSAHGSYFDRVSAFQDGFDDGPEACRDDFGRDRLFTQGEFQTDEDFATKGNADYGFVVGALEPSLSGVWDQAFREVFRKSFTAPAVEPFSRNAPDCARDADLDLVFCAGEQLVAYDQSDLTQPAYQDIGDFAVVTAVAIPYAQAARDQLGLSDEDPAGLRSAVCLTGWYAAKVYNGQAGLTISPGDLDESIRFLLTYGRSTTVLPAAELSGFELVDLFRNGFEEGLRACDVGA